MPSRRRIFERHGFQAQLDEDRYAYGVYRSSGFMGHPLTLAFNAMIFCLFCFGQGLYLARSRLDSARLWILQSGLVFLIVSLSGSRYPTILTLILLLLATLYQFKQSHAERRLQFFGLLTAVAACFCALFFFDLPMWGRMAEFWDASQTMEQRFDRLVFWKVHLQLGLQAPFFGVGLLHYKDILFEAYNQFGFAELEHKYNAHNMYLQNFAEFGLLGLISLAVFLGGLVRIGRLFWQHSRNISLVLLCLGVITGALMQNTLRDSEYLFGLWFCIAAVGILYQESVHPSRN
ncbi:MAG: O-antigen ligase family protein [Proteobacteria bacterium]|nr:O-antigen ligase family protein [Pseudomonadota bacterium]